MSTVKDLLEDWESTEGLDPTGAAARLGYSLSMYAAIKRWNGGLRPDERRPKLSRCLEFQEVTGVPASLFYPEIRGLL